MNRMSRRSPAGHCRPPLYLRNLDTSRQQVMTAAYYDCRVHGRIRDFRMWRGAERGRLARPSFRCGQDARAPCRPQFSFPSFDLAARIVRPRGSVVILKATRNHHREVGKLADQVSGPLRVLVESRREQVMAIAARNHASRVRLFGSAARGEDRPDSDIDLLVDFDQGSSLFDLIRMSRELEALLGRTVDVVSAGGLKSRDRAILAESVDL